MSNLMTEIGQETILRGTVHAEEDLLVLGRVEGTVVTSGDLTVESEALVAAEVTARQVVIRGALVGDIQASELVQIGAGARVSGNITAPRISVEEGAQVSGLLVMGAAPAMKAAPVKKAAPAKRAAAPVIKAAPAKKAAPPVMAEKKAAPAKKETTAKPQRAKPKAKARKAPPKPPTAAGKKVRTRRK